MIINLNEKDLIEFNKLYKMMEYNTKFINVLSCYLNNNEITEKIINNFKNETKLNNITSFNALFNAFYIDELNLSDNEKEMLSMFLKESVKELKIQDYFNNLYSLKIKVDNQKYNNWEFKTTFYNPFQGFIYDETKVDEITYFKETPSLGFFSKKYYYSQVLENNHEWMTITPNEINTMKQAINDASGNVLTFGLGLGYFTYMVSLKENVNNVIVIEKDKNVIELFETKILPLFDYKEKIKIINIDAFEYLKNNELDNINYVFVDIWHDVSDGLPLYLEFKKLEDNYNVEFNYWIENEILLLIRKIIIRLINESINNIDSLNVKSSNKEIDAIYIKVYNLLKDITLNSYYDIYKLLKKDNLRIFAKYIH